ncbi:MAG TPA: glycine cleavage system protein GcvH [Candidatus Marinimicrobia bacterium]|nr:glycine cleavage system protein GcvH [Candidatus Neomarinimicrobiota bacterium]
MNIPAELKYSTDHEWVRVEANVATIGITDFAQGELGDVVFVELPEVGSDADKDEPLGTVEAVKTVADLLAPISGKVIEINEGLNDQPEVVNSDPYGEGWMVKIEISDIDELDSLMDAAAYQEHIG